MHFNHFKIDIFDKKVFGKINVFTPLLNATLSCRRVALGVVSPATWFNAPQSRAGFTLIEALVAIALIAGGIVSALSLTTRSVFNASRLKQDLVAVNLAQEGIELIRLIRENNVLCDFLNGADESQDVCAWDREPRTSGNPECKNPGGPKLNSTQGYTVDTEDMIASVACTDPVSGLTKTLAMPRLGGNCSAPGSVLRINSSGVYNYSSGTPTPFRRCVYVCNPVNGGGPLGLDGKPVCSGTSDTTGGIPADAQMDVISIVAWPEGGGLKSTRLEQRLYNWR